MSSGTLYDKVWDLHRVAELPGGSTQLFVGLHLIHEVTSLQAFSALKDKGLTVRCPERTVATVDHIVPTTSQQRPFADPLAEEMLSTLESELPGARHSSQQHRQWTAGHRSCDCPGAGLDPAGHDGGLR